MKMGEEKKKRKKEKKEKHSKDKYGGCLSAFLVTF